MKRIEERHSRFLLILYRILAAVTLVLLLTILGGTLYALVFRSSPVFGAPKSPPESSAPAVPPPEGSAGAESRIFTGLGRLRVSTAGSGTLILSVTFPYYPGDRPFSEELASRVRQLREITTAYFASLSPDELRRRDEALIKGELLDRYNAILRLGQIEVLYFSDYMILE